MPRPLRIDYPGAVHHVFVRGVAKSKVALDASDYTRGIGYLERVVTRFELHCHAWCFLPNHTHLLLTSRLGNLSRAMHWLGTCTAQSFNQRHERYGHLYQGRFGSRLIEDDGHLLELARYVPLNPVRAGLCESPGDWAWSSYAATAGLRPHPLWLESRPFLDACGSAENYAAWVADGVLATRLDEHGVPRPPAKPSLADLLRVDSDAAIAIAHFRHGYSKADIAHHLGVHRSQIGRRLKRATE
ncbi:MAG TPA: transposase [Gaiellales bacterium]|jgi:REP element-mobilizing transposase RayT